MTVWLFLVTLGQRIIDAGSGNYKKLQNQYKISHSNEIKDTKNSSCKNKDMSRHLAHLALRRYV